MSRTFSPLVLATTAFAFVATGSTLLAGFGQRGLTELPADAYSLAQPEKLSTPRELQSSSSHLQLTPEAQAIAHRGEAIAEAEPTPSDSTPLRQPELLFPRQTVVLSAMPLTALLLPRATPQVQVKTEATTPAEGASSSIPEPMWFDPELEETMLKGQAELGANVAATLPSAQGWASPLPQRNLNRGILELIPGEASDFIYSASTESPQGSEELDPAADALLPTSESVSADKSAGLFAH